MKTKIFVICCVVGLVLSPSSAGTGTEIEMVPAIPRVLLHKYRGLDKQPRFSDFSKNLFPIKLLYIYPLPRGTHAKAWVGEDKGEGDFKKEIPKLFYLITTYSVLPLPVIPILNYHLVSEQRDDYNFNPERAIKSILFY